MSFIAEVESELEHFQLAVLSLPLPPYLLSCMPHGLVSCFRAGPVSQEGCGVHSAMPATQPAVMKKSVSVVGSLNIPTSSEEELEGGVDRKLSGLAKL